jgi:hypothetical protein
MDRGTIGWDRLMVAATTLRPALFPPRVAPRALAAAVVALVAGGWLMVLVVAVATGGDLTAGSAWWLALAGGAGCVSGVLLGSTGQAAYAAAVAVVAIGCLVLADAAAQPGHRGAQPQAAPAAREPAPVRERDTGRSRGNAPAAPGPKQTVRSYYAALDAHDFATAWAMLSPGVHAAFGGFETWRDGYESTLGHRVEDVTVAPGGVVDLVLVATDRTPCGGRTEQRFAVTWRLAGGQAASLGAVKLAGVDPAAAC